MSRARTLSKKPFSVLLDAFKVQVLTTLAASVVVVAVVVLEAVVVAVVVVAVVVVVVVVTLSAQLMYAMPKRSTRETLIIFI